MQYKGQRAKEVYEKRRPLEGVQVYMKLERNQVCPVLASFVPSFDAYSTYYDSSRLRPPSGILPGDEAAASLDDDVLDLIVSASVRDGVTDSLKETEEAALRRQKRCRCLQEISCRFANIADRYMYAQVHLSTVESLAQLYTQLDDRNSDVEAKLQAYTRGVSFGFTFDPCLAPLRGATPIFKQVERILEVCGDRLRAFRQVGAYLSPLPPTIWQALRTHCRALESLDGFTLELVTTSADVFVKELVSFQALKRLTTTIVWLPPSFVPEVRRRMLLTEDEKRRSGLLGRGCTKRFENLGTLRTPLLRWDNSLVEAMIIADLPGLHTLQLGVWDSDSVIRFLEKHGLKLLHVDLLLCRWSEWPSVRSRNPQALLRPPDRFQIEDIFTLCQHLQIFTIHQPESLRKLTERAGFLEGISRLKTIRLGSSDHSSYASMLEYQPFDELSFPFKNTADLRTTQRKLLTTEWKKLFPNLQHIEVYLPSFMLDASVPDHERESRWKDMMIGLVRGEEDIVPPSEVARALEQWQVELEGQGVELLVRESPVETM